MEFAVIVLCQIAFGVGAILLYRGTTSRRETTAFGASMHDATDITFRVIGSNERDGSRPAIYLHQADGSFSQLWIGRERYDDPQRGAIAAQFHLKESLRSAMRTVPEDRVTFPPPLFEDESAVR